MFSNDEDRPNEMYQFDIIGDTISGTAGDTISLRAASLQAKEAWLARTLNAAPEIVQKLSCCVCSCLLKVCVEKKKKWLSVLKEKGIDVGD